MKIEMESKTDEEIRFVLSDVTLEFANLVRRYALTAVPTFAITEAAVYENTSSFFDEYIIHRMGLVPLTTPSKLREGDEVTLMVDIEGPGTVYSNSMKSTDKTVKPVSDKIPLVKLTEGQRLRVEAKAIPGLGSTHTRHQAGLASYGYDEEGEFNFVIESFGQMKAIDILNRTLSAIEENAEEIAKQLKKQSK